MGGTEEGARLSLVLGTAAPSPATWTSTKAEEAISQGELLKQQGNKLFRLEQLERAMVLYAQAYSLVEDLVWPGKQSSGQVVGYVVVDALVEPLKQLKLTLHLNMAAGLLKWKDYRSCMNHCDAAQAVRYLEGGLGAKILFRRGQACARLGLLEDAWFDFDMALGMDPTNQAIRQEQALLVEAYAREGLQPPGYSEDEEVVEEQAQCAGRRASPTDSLHRAPWPVVLGG